MSSERQPPIDDLLAGFDFAQAAAATVTSHKRDTETLLLALVDLVDSLQTLERHYVAITDADQGRGPAGSVSMMIKRALQAMEQVGATAMPCTGAQLDLTIHEVVEVRSVDGIPSDTILEEVQRGYVWRNKTLRPAKVVIAAEETQ